jgi:hypothetical protein
MERRLRRDDGVMTSPPPEGPGHRGRRRTPRGIDRGPRRLAESLDDAVAGLAPPAGPGGGPAAAPSAGTLGAVFSRWEEIVGGTLARHVQPVTLSGDTLTVAVDQPAWATQVRVLAETILRRVAEVTGAAPPALRVTVRAPRGRV